MADIRKLAAEELLKDVPPDKRFWCQDGRVLKNMRDLEVALNEMGEVTFRNHRNETKNDFSKWVKDVVGDKELSKDLQKSTSRTESAKRVADRITWLKLLAEWSPLFRPPSWPF